MTLKHFSCISKCKMISKEFILTNCLLRKEILKLRFKTVNKKCKNLPTLMNLNWTILTQNREMISKDWRKKITSSSKVLMNLELSWKKSIPDLFKLMDNWNKTLLNKEHNISKKRKLNCFKRKRILSSNQTISTFLYLRLENVCKPELNLIMLKSNNWKKTHWKFHKWLELTTII